MFGPPIRREELAIDVSPVPPYSTPIDVVAPTTPFLASIGPFKEPRLNDVAVNVPAVRVPIFPVVANRFVDEAVVEKKLVEVAFVVVAFTPVKFWRVVDPVRRRLERVERPPVAVRVPVKFAVLEIF